MLAFDGVSGLCHCFVGVAGFVYVCVLADCFVNY